MVIIYSKTPWFQCELEPYAYLDFKTKEALDSSLVEPNCEKLKKI